MTSADSARRRDSVTDIDSLPRIPAVKPGGTYPNFGPRRKESRPGPDRDDEAPDHDGNMRFFCAARRDLRPIGFHGRRVRHRL